MSRALELCDEVDRLRLDSDLVRHYSPLRLYDLALELGADLRRALAVVEAARAFSVAQDDFHLLCVLRAALENFDEHEGKL